MIDAFASLPHYLAHILPVWEALPEHVKGALYVGPRAGGTQRPWRPPATGPRLLVASWADMRDYPQRRIVLMEHGAGQSYTDRHPSYAGGLERDNVDLFLCPGPHPAERNRQAYPDAAVVEVGCPALDHWLISSPRIDPLVKSFRAATEGLVAVTWHWNNPFLPETRWAWPAYAPAVAALPWKVVGTCHPRARSYFERAYRRLGIRLAEWDEVMERAAVLVVDNSSAGFELAATGRPVVWVNGPDYRPDVSHGLRFYDACPERIGHPRNLRAAVGSALEGTYGLGTKVDQVYSHLDGRSAERAANAILSLLEESEAA